MAIIAIDPGYVESAWVELDGTMPKAHAKEVNALLLRRLRADWDPTQCKLAIEGIASYGMAVGKEVFETCYMIGRLIEAWTNRGGQYEIIYRMQVKRFHCGTTRANDANIRAALLDRYGPTREIAVGTKRQPGALYGIKGDEWSALAIALTAEGTSKLFAPPRQAQEQHDLAAEGNPF